MASNKNADVELIQPNIEYVLIEQQDDDKSSASAPKDMTLMPGLQVISPGNVTSQANLTAMYQFSPLAEQISGHDVASQIQPENMLSQEHETLLKCSTAATTSLTSSATESSSQLVKAFATMADMGDVQTELQALNSESMGYIVEVSREMPLTSTQLEAAPVVRIVNDSLSSDVLTSLPPGSHIIFNSSGRKYPQLMSALTAKQNEFKSGGSDSDNTLCDGSLTKHVLLNKADVMLNSDMQTFPSADKDIREMTMGHDADAQISHTDSIQSVMNEEEPITDEGSLTVTNDRKKVSEENHMKAVQNIAWPQNDTCKVSLNCITFRTFM